MRIPNSMLLAIFFIFILNTDKVLAAPAAGPLKALSSNPRYFTDGSGKAVYLTGSHTWANMKDENQNNPPTPFDFNLYLNFLQSRGHNFIRLWYLELTKYQYNSSYFIYTDPQPWQRTGPGNALDGKPKFDLNKINQAYFDRLRSRVIAARDRGMYVSIMFFEGHGVQKSLTPWASNGHPFNVNNNINGINGDVNNDGRITDIHTLANSSVTGIQEAYVRKVIDTVNDLDNVLYEIGNEVYPASTDWQYHMIDFIKNYEKTKTKQHPVGMTFQFQGGLNSTLWDSPADWISPNSEGGYRDNPPAGDGKKVVISDTDHLWGIGGDKTWVWKTFTRGLNPIYMDSFPEGGMAGDDPLPDESARKAMGDTLSYANKMNLAAMTPQNSLASTGYCLAYPGNEYLAYQPSSGSFSINLTAGAYNYEWFNPATNKIVSSGTVSAPGGNYNFTPPWSGDAVIYIKRSQSSYPGPNPHTIPGIVEAENYDSGGEGIAYHDTDTSNNGGELRSDGVDLELCSEGGNDIGWTQAGEWLEYTINISKTGNYDVTARVAAADGNSGAFHIEFNGADKTGKVSVPATGGWQTWTDIKKTNVSLSAGNQIMRVYLDANAGGNYGFNLNYFKLAESGDTQSPSTPSGLSVR